MRMRALSRTLRAGCRLTLACARVHTTDTCHACHVSVRHVCAVSHTACRWSTNLGIPVEDMNAWADSCPRQARVLTHACVLTPSRWSTNLGIPVEDMNAWADSCPMQARVLTHACVLTPSRWSTNLGIPVEDMNAWADSCPNQPGYDQLGNWMTYSSGACYAALGHFTLGQVRNRFPSTVH